METRGWKLCICFGLLSVALAKDASQSVPGARQDESTFTEFTLVSDSKSHLFSSCFDELNTGEATLHAIEVDEGKEYIRYLIDSDAEVTWEDVEGEDDLIACAFKANEAGSLMFKYSNGVCSLATEGVYSPKDASCDGEEVFIISPLDICFTTLGTEPTGFNFIPYICETNCGSDGILIDENGAELGSDSIPSEIVECCTEETDVCFKFMDSEALPCDVDRMCLFMGLGLPIAETSRYLDHLKEFRATLNDYSDSKILVNARYLGGAWYHIYPFAPVQPEEWEDGQTIPSNEEFVVLNANGKLEVITISDTVPIICAGELPPCSEQD